MIATKAKLSYRTASGRPVSCAAMAHVLRALMRLDGRRFTKRVIADETGLHMKTVQCAIIALEELRFISAMEPSEHDRSNAPHRGPCCCYKVDTTRIRRELLATSLAEEIAKLCRN